MSILFDHDIKWDPILQFGTRHFFKEKAIIYRQGTLEDGFYYLQKGLINVTTTTISGNDRLLNIAVPGQILGLQGMDQKSHFTTATAIKDSILYYFSFERFEKLMIHHPSLFNTFIRTVIHKMHILADKIYLDTLLPNQQLARILLNICYDFKNKEVPLSQQDLVKSTGLNRVTIYKLLKQWKEENVIEYHEKNLIIKKPDVLKKLLD
ncbi:Crp/Fnr family transcriptional regulator [Neobacillus drentensis]|uniref:Crp/Fnr family transcriptional regulator n=1 Tax=Neobacillus drentensis TaxID=220684 RepID=UPI002FFF2BF5